jgi:hypothetical protein
MALSANLYLRQSQSLVMTPQLMQSIQLLQMTHFELTQFIAQEVEKNPLLEFPSNDAETGSDACFRRGRCARPSGRRARSDEDYDSRSEVMSGDWSDRTDSAGAGRMNDELDANYANVFPDDGVPQRADAPELISQWKSMPGGGEGRIPTISTISLPARYRFATIWRSNCLSFCPTWPIGWLASILPISSMRPGICMPISPKPPSGWAPA